MTTYRWEKGDLSTREMSTLTDNPNPSLNLSLAGILGGRFQTTVLLRIVSLMLLKKKSDLIKHQCVKLHTMRSIDEEVLEVVKRSIIVRLHESREEIGKLIGISEDEGLKCMRNVPDLMAEVAKIILPIKRVLTARKYRSFLSLSSSPPLSSCLSLTLPLSNQQSLPLSILTERSILFKIHKNNNHNSNEDDDDDDNNNNKNNNNNNNNNNVTKITDDSSIDIDDNYLHDDSNYNGNSHCGGPTKNNNNSAISSTPCSLPSQSLPLSIPLRNSSKSDIYTILKEMTELTGRLSADACAFRKPMIMRDDQLLTRGFMKQAKADYLELRQLVQGPHEVDSKGDSLTEE